MLLQKVGHIKLVAVVEGDRARWTGRRVLGLSGSGRGLAVTHRDLRSRWLTVARRDLRLDGLADARLLDRGGCRR